MGDTSQKVEALGLLAGILVDIRHLKDAAESPDKRKAVEVLENFVKLFGLLAIDAVYKEKT